MSLSRIQVYPDNTSGDSETIVTATLYSSDPGTSVSGKMIQFSSKSKELSGGHSHSGERPTGEFEFVSCVTLANGSCSVRYGASEVGGIETISGVIADDPTVSDSNDLIVAVPGLFEVAGGNSVYRLTGQTTAHPSNHFMSSSASGIFNVVSDFYDEFNATLGLNDMSLSSGGLFDIGPKYGAFWDSPHQSHRLGKGVDIDHCARDVSDDDPLAQGACSYFSDVKRCSDGCELVERNDIRSFCESAGGHLVIESNFHCEFR